MMILMMLPVKVSDFKEEDKVLRILSYILVHELAAPEELIPQRLSELEIRGPAQEEEDREEEEEDGEEDQSLHSVYHSISVWLPSGAPDHGRPLFRPLL
ncbi:unnamed protein product [Gadus morhua 'NCC']